MIRVDRARSSFRAAGFRGVLALLLVSLPAGAIEPPAEPPPLPEKLRAALEQVDFARYDLTALPVPAAAVPTGEAELPGLASFEEQHPGAWTVQVDPRTNAPRLIEGQGLALLPGAGNQLAAPAFGEAPPSAEGEYALPDVAAVVDGFIAQSQDLLRVDPADLTLNESASVGVGRGNRFWSLSYQPVFRDPDLGPIPIRGAQVFFRISQGNLIQFGNELASAPVGIDTSGIVSQEEVTAKALDLLGVTPSMAPTIAEPAVDVGQSDRTLQIVPANAPDGSLEHVLVRSVLVETPDLTLELWFDAKSGDLVYAIDRRLPVDASVRGGIFPITNTDPQLSRGLPFLRVDNAGVVKTTDLAGVYDYAPPGSAATASLTGDFVRINDNCGASSLSAASGGDLDFGVGGGTDCGSTGVGGPGNTRSARSTYFHVNQIQEKARSYLNQPAVTTPWLQGQLLANVNINNTCNAFWSPGSGTINFYRSGGGCSNTGEIAAVFLHEFGHGLDQNTNGAAPENGSGEAYGDTIAFLETHDPCIGDNFRPGNPCSFGCNASCTGVRHVAVRPFVRPSTITAAPADCDRFACPYRVQGIFPYQGPMGYEGHCESLIASGAVWDMIQAFIGRYGDGAGWALGERIWYDSLYMTGSAYQVVSGGKCNASATVNGCGAANWYTVFLSLDDDNGNLADGTPNADLIWNAFNDHGIACGAAAPPVSSSCPTLAAPTLTLNPGTGQNMLTWTPVANAALYRVLRNSFGPGRGFTTIAEVAAPTVNFTDSAIDATTPFSYAIQAVGSNDVCFSPFSNVATAGVTQIILSPSNVRVREGRTAALTATVTDGGAVLPGVVVTFTSANPSVATVPGAATTNASGVAQAIVTGVAQGNTSIQAVAAGASGQATVEVRRASPAASTASLVVTILAALLALWILERRARRGAER